MSIRNFKMEPCPVCKTDTLHFAMKCRECGHVNETHNEAWDRRKKARLMSRINKGMDHACAAANAGRYQKVHADAKREMWKALPFGVHRKSKPEK